MWPDLVPGPLTFGAWDSAPAEPQQPAPPCSSGPRPPALHGPSAPPAAPTAQAELKALSPGLSVHSFCTNSPSPGPSTLTNSEPGRSKQMRCKTSCECVEAAPTSPANISPRKYLGRKTEGQKPSLGRTFKNVHLRNGHSMVLEFHR